MVVYGGVSSSVTRCATTVYNHKLMFGVNAHSDNNKNRKSSVHLALRTSSFGLVATTVAVAVAAAASVLIYVVGANAVEIAPQDVETFSNIPDTLSSECESDKNCKKPRIQRPKSKKAEFCTVRCVNTCIHGGDASGSLSMRGPMVVFRKGFRSRQYCLVECSDICNLIGDGEDGF